MTFTSVTLSGETMTRDGARMRVNHCDSGEVLSDLVSQLLETVWEDEALALRQCPMFIVNEEGEVLVSFIYAPGGENPDVLVTYATGELAGCGRGAAGLHPGQ